MHELNESERLKKIYCLAQKELNLTLKIHIKMNGAPTTANEKMYCNVYNYTKHTWTYISFHTRARFYRRVSRFFWTRIAIFLHGWIKNKRCLGSFDRGANIFLVDFLYNCWSTVVLLRCCGLRCYSSRDCNFLEDILFFRARDYIGTLLFLERTCFYFFTRLNKKTNVVWDRFDRWANIFSRPLV